MPRRFVAGEITPRDREVLQYVWQFAELHLRAPTLREIATALGFTHRSALRHVSALITAGELKRDRRGRLVVSGIEAEGPALARVVGAEAEWVTAPEPGLQALYVGGELAPEGFRPGDLVFFSEAGADDGTTWAVVGHDGGHSIRGAVKTEAGFAVRLLKDDPLQPPVRLIGLVRYQLRKFG